MLAQVISGLLAAVYELDIRCAQLDTLACTITTHILSMVDSSKSDAHDEGYVIDELGVMAPPASVPTENRTTSSSPLLVSAGMFTGQSGIMSSQSPVPEATDAVTPQNEPRDPQVASLRSIFPDYDEAILQSVLESVDGDQDRAIDLLLGMNDPDFRSEAMPPTQQPQMAQEELDEQFARQLMLEEQQQVQQRQQQYHPRNSRIQGQSQQQLQQQQIGSPPVGGKDTMAEIQEQVSKYAEIGKKSLVALVSKVKTKIQEFDKPDTGGGASGVQSTWSGAGGPSYYDPDTTRRSASPRTNYRLYQGPTGVQNTPSTAPTSSQPVAFYDPDSSPQPISATGYEVEPIANDARATGSAPTALQTVAISSASTSLRGPSPANPIDGGKLGLLPKRPISLIRDPPKIQPPTQKRNSDPDELEYAENPFDDSGK
ncbi:hypothetical protein Ac2012v2_004608 [Leucoagaricus gongylophorus]